MANITDSDAFELCADLRAAGYCVIIWTPEEIAGISNLSRLDDRITELGNETISYFRESGF